MKNLNEIMAFDQLETISFECFRSKGLNPYPWFVLNNKNESREHCIQALRQRLNEPYWCGSLASNRSWEEGEREALQKAIVMLQNDEIEHYKYD